MIKGMPSFRGPWAKRLKAAGLGLVLVLAFWGCLELLKIWGEHTVIQRADSVVKEFKNALSRENGNFSSLRNDIQALEKSNLALLDQLQTNLRAQKDQLLTAVRTNGPPVVLAIFPPTETSLPILEGLKLSGPDKNSHLTPQCEIEYLPEAASPDDTIKEIRSRLSKENIVLIIGHESSQTAKEINERLYEAKEFVDAGNPVPLILPAATNPELTKSPSRGIRHILRLPANDEQQIVRIRNLVGPKGLNSKRIMLILDSSNLAYANYIARGLILGKDAIKIVDSVGVGLAGDGFSPARFISSDPDTVVFIGMEVHADLMLRRLAKDTLPKSTGKLNLIFTDGVAGNTFQTTSRDLMSGSFGGKVRIFVTGPFPTGSRKGDDVGSLPNFRQYGAAARELAEYLVNSGHEQITRQSVLEGLQRMLRTGPQITFAGLLVKFDANGDIIEGEEHVYEQGAKQAKHSSLCSCKR